MSSVANSPTRHQQPANDLLKLLVQNPMAVALVAILMLLAMVAAYVHVLNELVAGGERTRESWRTAEVVKSSERTRVRDLRASAKPAP